MKCAATQFEVATFNGFGGGGGAFARHATDGRKDGRQADFGSMIRPK